MDIIEALAITLTGIVIVFIVLTVLTFIIRYYGAVVGLFTRKKQAPTVTPPPTAEPVVEIPQTAADDGEDGRIAAVIAAAVAAISEQEGIKLKVKSITPRTSQRNAWGEYNVSLSVGG